MGTDRFNNHEVLVLAFQRVDLNCFKEVVLGSAKDNGGCSTEVAREVANGHAGAVDLAIVSCKEQIHVLAVTNNGLVNGAGVRSGYLSSEEWLRSGPTVCVRRIGRCFVGERGRAPLISEHPDVLWGKLKECRCNSARVHLVLACRTHLRPVGKESKVH